MKNGVIEVLKAISDSGKFEILKHLTDRPKTHNELCTISGLSPSTISRYLKVLCRYGIVEKKNNHYSLTGIGYYLADYLSSLEEIFEICEFLKISPRFVKTLPIELKSGLVTLKTAERFEKPYEIIAPAIRDIESMSVYALFADSVVDDGLIRAVWLKCLQGVRIRAIIPPAIFERKAMAGARAVKLLESEGYGAEKVVSALRRSVEVRTMDVPMQLAVIDGKAVYFQALPDNTFESPAYMSRDRKCICWAECLFEYCWNTAKPADYVSRLEEFYAML